MTDDDGDSIEVAPCPECGSLATYWDPLVRDDSESREDPDTESATCDTCGASFSLSETVLINEQDLIDYEGGEDGGD